MSNHFFFDVLSDKRLSKNLRTETLTTTRGDNIVCVVGVGIIIATVHIRRKRVLGEGFLIVKNHTVHYPVILKNEGDPTSQHDEDRVLDDNNNKISFKTEVQGYPSSNNYEGLTPFTNPKKL